ncbi:hypothetical protein MIND_01251500 [Mycena indigotica]|uniref:F-box domain-containing protein n=1 Tax=Mycena indigotica TaxID=2126181 RepID=A0A8H6S551_9AGAR|nr:uncharacterized protein MIND_01251500 [Mycena indigotica]KAF7292241.1 hypothetical protein MIND_01251500 [Mycena indigotica]
MTPLLVAPNPLDIPELIDLCLSNLHSQPDLCSCALVARSWVHPAQTRLFSTLRFHSDEKDWFPRIARLVSPQNSRLLPHIHHLIVRNGFTGIAELEGMLPLLGWTLRGRISCPNLTRLTFLYDGPPLSRMALVGLRDLLSLPTLHTVTIKCSGGFASERDFCRVWAICSPNIRHLIWMCNWPEESSWPTAHLQTTIQLRSLCLPRKAHPRFARKMLELLPFTLENLTTLSVSSINYSAVLWNVLQNKNINNNNIRELHFRVEIFDPDDDIIGLDLANFPHLAFLDLAFPRWQHCLDLLAALVRTIPPTNRLHAIQLELYATANDAFSGSCEPQPLCTAIAGVAGVFELWLKMDPAAEFGLWRVNANAAIVSH